MAFENVMYWSGIHGPLQAMLLSGQIWPQVDQGRAKASRRELFSKYSFYTGSLRQH